MDIEALKKDLPQDKASAIDALVQERDELKQSNEQLGQDIKQKDDLIAQKNNDIAGTRREMQRLKALTAEEREQMTQKEIEHHEQLLAMQQERDEERKQMQDREQRERESRLTKAIKARVGDDEKLASKLRENMESFKDSEKAWTEDEISSLADKGFSLIPSEDRPENPVAHAGAASVGSHPGNDASKTNFAETPEGQELARKMGLSSAQKPSDQNSGGNAPADGNQPPQQ